MAEQAGTPSLRTFVFSDSNDRQSSAGVLIDGELSADSCDLTLQIPEVLSPSFGMHVWSSAVVLAQFIWYNRSKFPNRNVLELGAGTALPGIVAAKCKANVTLSDNIFSPASIKNCRFSCEVNEVKDVAIMPLNWGNLCCDTLAFRHLDYVIASDCFYDPNDFEDILATVSMLLERNTKSRFWCTYQIRRSRSTTWNISDLLLKWELRCTDIPLSTFDANVSNIAKSNLPGSHTVQMLEIVPNSRYLSQNS